MCKIPVNLDLLSKLVVEDSTRAFISGMIVIVKTITTTFVKTGETFSNKILAISSFNLVFYAIISYHYEQTNRSQDRVLSIYMKLR